MFCTNCGHKIEEGALFCTNCGKPVASDGGAAPVEGAAAAGTSVQDADAAPVEGVGSAEASAPAEDAGTAGGTGPAEPPASAGDVAPAGDAAPAPAAAPAGDAGPASVAAPAGDAGPTPPAAPAAMPAQEMPPMPPTEPEVPTPQVTAPVANGAAQTVQVTPPDAAPAPQPAPAWQHAQAGDSAARVSWTAGGPTSAPGPAAAPAPGPAPASSAAPAPDAASACAAGAAPAPAAAPAAAMPSPDIFNDQPRKKRSAGKTAGIVAGIIALIAVLGVAGYFVYTTFFATSPQDVIAADLNEQLASYSDPESGLGDRLLTEADSVLSGLGAYDHPDDDAYISWLEDTSYQVGEVTIAEDGETATATATVTHEPLISYVENYMGDADDPGDEQETELSVTYRRSGSEWSVSSNELRDAVFAAYLPTDEELILSDVYWYFGDTDSADEDFISGLESTAGNDLDTLGISADEFADAFLDGFSYEVGDVTVDGDAATVEVTVTIKSMDEISAEFEKRFSEWASGVDPSTISSEDELYKQGGQIFLEVTRDAKAKENQVELSFTQDSSGVWWMDSAAEQDLMGVLGV